MASVASYTVPVLPVVKTGGVTVQQVALRWLIGRLRGV